MPALKGLLDYIDQKLPPQTINKYYTTFRKHTTLLKRTTQKRDVRVLLDVYAPVVYNKRVTVNKTIRPIFIFPHGGLA